MSRLSWAQSDPVGLEQCLTRAPLGYSAERTPLRGGGQILPPLPNSRTNRRSEAGEAVIESPEREDSNAHQKFSLRGHM